MMSTYIRFHGFYNIGFLLVPIFHFVYMPLAGPGPFHQLFQACDLYSRLHWTRVVVIQTCVIMKGLANSGLC